MTKIPIFSPHFILLSLVFFCLAIVPVTAYAPSTICSAYGYGSHYVLATTSSGSSPTCIMYLSGGGSCTGSTPDLPGGTWHVWHDAVNYSCPAGSGASFVSTIEYPVPTTSPTPTPTPTPTPSENCVSACGYTWTSGFTADDVLLQMCVALSPLTKCELCGWQMAAMEEQFPCVVPPEVVPTYAPTPLPTVPPPPTALPTLPPGPSPGPQVIEMGGGDTHGIDFTVPTIATIAIPVWNRTAERGNITALAGNFTAGNLTDPYLNSVDGFSVGVTSLIQKIFYLPNWVMAHIYSSIQPVAVAFVDIVTVVCEWGSIPLQLMRLALDNTPFGIQALLIYGVCLEMIIYLLRGDT